MDKRRCPQCGRLVNVKRNKFNDLIFNQHRMGSFSDNAQEVLKDHDPQCDRDRTSLSETTCPMSGQVIE